MEKLLSVIIPAYNVEHYLMTCMGSLLLPEFVDDIEILIVNDGSTDNTESLARAYETEYPDTVRVISKSNGGHGSALNAGIAAATGKYVRCVDGDDWVDAPAFAALLQKLAATDADIVATRFLWVDHETGLEDEENSYNIFDYVECGREYAFSEIAGLPYIKMHQMNYRTRLLQESGVRMDEHCFYVDVEYVLLPIVDVKTVLFLDLNVYRYRMGTSGQSVAIANMRKNVNDHLRVLNRMLSCYDEACGKGENPREKASPETLEYLANGIARLVVSQAKIWLSFPAKRIYRKKLTELRKLISENYPDIYAKIGNRAVKMLFDSKETLFIPLSWMVTLRGH